MTSTPIPAPTADPSPDPTADASPDPTHEPSADPTPEPSAQPAPEPSLDPADTPWRRLSPRMLAVHPIMELLRALPALLAVLFASNSTGHGGLWGLLAAGLAIGMGLLRWATTSYRVTGAQIQVRRGFLRRRVLSVPVDRVRTVDLTSHALHRILGLTRVTIGTGQSDRRKEDLRLDGLTAAETDRLRVQLLHRGLPAAPDAMPTTTVPTTAMPTTGMPTTTGPAIPAARSASLDDHPASPADPTQLPAPAALRTPTQFGGPAQRPAPDSVLAELRPGWVRYGPFTLSGVVTVGVVGGFLYRLATEAHVSARRIGPLHSAGAHLARVPLPVAILEVVLVGMLLVAIASAAGYVLAFWSFRLTRQDAGTLQVSRGLITTRAITIEERRLRGVELSEPLLLRAVGGARCIAIATGLRVGRGAERGGSLLLPPAPRAEAARVAIAVLADPTPIEAALRPHGRTALRRRLVRALIGTALVPAALGLLSWQSGWPAWPALVTLLLVPLGGALAADRYRSLGHTVTPRHLVIRQGSLVRRRSALARDGIIGWHLRQSFFQRRAGVVTVIATTAAGRQRYALPDVPVDASVPLVDEATPDLLRPFLASTAVPVR